MITALLDTNVLLDVVLDRAPFVKDSGAVWRACDAGEFSGFVSANSITTIYYIVEKTRGRRVALDAVDQTLAAFEVSPVYRETLEAARGLGGPDFEDDVLVASAVISLVDCIVTRNSGDFASSSVPVYSPADFLARLAAPPKSP
jgi:predicted nucleic acid-binding protein